ncbi:MAG TPA: hypothetical protein VFY03_00445 [Woeseiaceae bacterium]|nr:hypothetical protein [Woeseiaceae bacterium]
MNRNDRRRLAALLMTLLCPLGAVADPPFRDVLIDVPLDLSDLPNIISKVAVECELSISNVTPATSGTQLIRTGRTEVNVVNGSVMQTVQVLVTVPSITRLVDPTYLRDAEYVCNLRGFLEEGLGWHDFVIVQTRTSSTTQGTLPQIVLTSQSYQTYNSTRQPGMLGGTLRWTAVP